MKHVTTVLAIAAALLVGCGDQIDPKIFEIGPNGEAPAALELSYSKRFVVLEKQYFEALSAYYEFVQHPEFDSIHISECFREFFEVRFSKSQLPCIVMSATRGAPFKVYTTFSLEDGSFLGISETNHVRYRIDIFSWRGHGEYDHLWEVPPPKLFQTQFENLLTSLDEEARLTLGSAAESPGDTSASQESHDPHASQPQS